MKSLPTLMKAKRWSNEIANDLFCADHCASGESVSGRLCVDAVSNKAVILFVDEDKKLEPESFKSIFI